MPEPLNEGVRRRFRKQQVRDTAAEIAIRRALHAAGLRYRVDAKPEPDLRVRADVLFTRQRVAVFIDGCFWHGCPNHFIPPKNNAAWWAAKIRTNQDRDLASRALLAERGWVVLAFWEHEDVADVVGKVQKLVRT